MQVMLILILILIRLPDLFAIHAPGLMSGGCALEGLTALFEGLLMIMCGRLIYLLV